MKGLGNILVLFVFVAVCCGIRRKEAVHVKVHRDAAEHCTIIAVGNARVAFSELTENDYGVHVESKRAVSPSGDANLKSADSSMIYDIYTVKQSVMTSYIQAICKTKEEVKALSKRISPSVEIRKIVDNGDQENRIDVVFMGDGYTESEKEKFYDDMDRLVQDMFTDVTFRSWLPVFNIWAIFDPSVESGIGYNGAKDTAFQLYREAGQLRAIFTNKAWYAREVCAMTGPSGCDYPSLIGNDDFYGGLGGEFVISTKSERTGTVVLRHEMGHNFVEVGEEYDGGWVYSGVNSAKSYNNVGWSHWLSGEPREERAIYRILEYPWKDLNKDGEQTFTFTSDGTYSRWYLIVSVSAAGEEDCLEFLLDGEVLPWKTRGYDDREFYDWYGDQGFSAGEHTFTVRTKSDATHPDIPRMICNINLHEFGSEDEFVMDNDHVSSYATWDIRGAKTVRPTNAGCLMRNMTHPLFCNICKEGMWYQFFERVGLIDKVEVAPEANPDGTTNVSVFTLQLGRLRDPRNEVEGEKLNVRWFLNGQEQPSWQNLFAIPAVPGSWEVEVELETPEVRFDPKELLKDRESFIIS